VYFGDWDDGHDCFRTTWLGAAGRLAHAHERWRADVGAQVALLVSSRRRPAHEQAGRVESLNYLIDVYRDPEPGWIADADRAGPLRAVTHARARDLARQRYGFELRAARMTNPRSRSRSRRGSR
jgi:hypothetical protein